MCGGDDVAVAGHRDVDDFNAANFGKSFPLVRPDEFNPSRRFVQIKLPSTKLNCPAKSLATRERRERRKYYDVAAAIDSTAKELGILSCSNLKFAEQAVV